MDQHNSHDSRRDFLKTATAMAVAGGLPTLDTLANIAHAARGVGTESVDSDYKAIVCVMLFGGQDNSNVLIPYADAGGGQTEYDAYAAARNYRGTSAQNQASGNLSYSRAQLTNTALPATNSNSLTGGSATAGYTTNTHNRSWALHPSYSALRTLYGQGKVAVMANTGPLLQPTTRHQYYATRSSIRLPVNLYSHDDQQKAWMGGLANELNPQEGIGGRIASNLKSLNSYNQLSVAISTAGISPFLLTNDVGAQPYQVGVGAVGRIDSSTNPAFCNTNSTFIANNPAALYCLSGGPVRLFTGPATSGTQTTANAAFNAIRSRYSANPSMADVYSEQWVRTMDQSIGTEQVIRAALVDNPLSEDTVAPFVTYRPSDNPGATPIDIINPPAADPFSGFNTLAAQLRMVATLIRTSSQISSGGIKRQVFFVSLGGHDTHGTEFWRDTPRLAKRIDRALDAFWQALGNIKVTGSSVGNAQDKVTLFTMSDFGRTLDSNGGGSDHGWGMHSFVMGGAVNGGKVYGKNHNVDAALIPQDTQYTAFKSRWLTADLGAGALPRLGIPPARTSLTQTEQTIVAGLRANGLNHSLDRGELLPNMASDAYVATIARWFGVSTGSLATVFPNLTGTTGSDPNFPLQSGVGFMNGI
jgi:uncharacterized protein (DUF1501 family)